MSINTITSHNSQTKAWLSQIIILTGLFEAIYGWLQLLGIMGSRNILFPATGTFYNPGPFCGYIASILPLALNIRIYNPSKFANWLSSIYILLTLSILPSLLGRTGWLASIAGLLYVLYFTKKINLCSKHTLQFIIPTSCICLIGLIAIKPASALGRLLLWQIGFDAAYNAPIYGIGWHNVGGALGRSLDSYFTSHPNSIFTNVASSPEYPFNDFLRIAIAFGIPIMLIVISLFLLSICSMHKRREFGLAGSIISLFIVFLGSYPLEHPEFIIMISLISFIVASELRLPCLLNFCTASIIIIICSFSTHHIYRHQKNKIEWSFHRVYWNSNRGQFINKADSLSIIYNDVPEYLFDYAIALNKHNEFNISTRVCEEAMKKSADCAFLNLAAQNLQSLGEFSKAEEYLIQSINRLPNRLYPYLLLAKLYTDPRNPDLTKFKKLYNEFRLITPKIKSNVTDDIFQEMHRLAKKHGVS